MKKLLLMRHAKSDWQESGLKDFDRPLNDRGKKDAPRMGKFLQQIDNLPGMILASSAKRVQETIEGMTSKWEHRPEIVYVDELYSGSYRGYIEIIQTKSKPIDHLMIVGHNPTIEETAAAICSGSNAHNVFVFPTAAIACFEISVHSWSRLKRGGGDLKWFMIPKLLKKL